MKQISILIADDEVEIAELIGIHLEKEGYHVVKATDGEEAVLIIQSQPIDLVILDIMMPKMDGYEVTRQIRVKYNMPIIFLSAKTSDFDKVTGLVLGADDYMTKPFAPIELVAREINIASEKLKEAVERGDFAESSKDQLIVNLAHDLRTPLTSVLGYLDLILKDENLSKEQIKRFSMIAFAKSQRLESLIDELFEITRMNYGVLKLDKKTINISELLIQLDEELYPLLEKHHLEARLNVNPHLYIYGDGNLLARVFENLVTNAVRYGDNGQFVDMNGYIDNGEVIVQIINYGDSIPEEDLPYLFDMLYTGDKARTGQQGGTGLGLFNIVEQHNGTISAESNIIRTIFEIRLPKEESSRI